MGGWGGVVGQVRDKAIISTQVVVEVEVGVELGNSKGWGRAEHSGF